MKHRMLRFLVEKMGFRVFAIEANWLESLAVNDYVVNGNGDPAVALALFDSYRFAAQRSYASFPFLRMICAAKSAS